MPPSPGQRAASGLTQLLGAGGVSVTLKLYQNNITPPDPPVIGDLVECTFPGYKPIGGAGWSAPVLPGNSTAVVTSTPATWVRADSLGSQPVYGVYATALGGAVTVQQTLFARRLDPPTALSKKGQLVRVSLVVIAAVNQLTDGSEALVLGFDVKIEADYKKLHGIRRGRITKLVKAIRLVNNSDQREDDRVNAGGQHGQFFVSNGLLGVAMAAVTERADQLLSR